MDSTQEKSTLISVVIPAYNEAKIIRHTLEQINHAIDENKDQGCSWEVIVCDNDSTDRTAEIASEMGAKVFFEPFHQISRVRNTGAQFAKGHWLLFIDADSYPPPELLTEFLGVIGRGDAIGCGAAVLVKNGTLFNKLRIERLNPFYRLLNISGGAFIACQHQAFQSINGFSSHLYAYEDIDFVVRLKKVGCKQGKHFPILHLHPVITSGRKGEYKLWSIAGLFASNFLAVFIFILHYFLPKGIIEVIGKNSLGYWYDSRR